jgi:signal transduction histidine kinase
VGRRLTNDYVFEVADTGPGIPRESLGRIFEPFYRVPGAQAPGTGIGLATVSRIIEAHSGGIEVRSTPGQGTTFTVRLPAAAPAVPAAKIESTG